MTDKLHYVRIPNAQGGRAEMVRMCYVLSGRPYIDVLYAFSDAPAAVSGKNPFKQFPFVETPDGECIYQTLAIMHHAAQGTSAWPSDPDELTRALSVALGGYDLYQAFGAFSADDAAGKAKFESKQAPKFFDALAEIYEQREFAAGDNPCFADCIVHQAVAWCARRNELCHRLLESKAELVAFQRRFESLPEIAAFIEHQAASRRNDNTV
jgi:glutathione S-transferase